MVLINPTVRTFLRKMKDNSDDDDNQFQLLYLHLLRCTLLALANELHYSYDVTPPHEYDRSLLCLDSTNNIGFL